MQESPQKAEQSTRDSRTDSFWHRNSQLCLRSSREAIDNWDSVFNDLTAFDVMADGLTPPLTTAVPDQVRIIKDRIQQHTLYLSKLKVGDEATEQHQELLNAWKEKLDELSLVLAVDLQRFDAANKPDLLDSEVTHTTVADLDSSLLELSTKVTRDDIGHHTELAIGNIHVLKIMAESTKGRALELATSPPVQLQTSIQMLTENVNILTYSTILDSFKSVEEHFPLVANQLQMQMQDIENSIAIQLELISALEQQSNADRLFVKASNDNQQAKHVAMQYMRIAAEYESIADRLREEQAESCSQLSIFCAYRVFQAVTLTHNQRIQIAESDDILGPIIPEGFTNRLFATMSSQNFSSVDEAIQYHVKEKDAPDSMMKPTLLDRLNRLYSGIFNIVTNDTVAIDSRTLQIINHELSISIDDQYEGIQKEKTPLRVLVQILVSELDDRSRKIRSLDDSSNYLNRDIIDICTRVQELNELFIGLDKRLQELAAVLPQSERLEKVSSFNTIAKDCSYICTEAIATAPQLQGSDIWKLRELHAVLQSQHNTGLLNNRVEMIKNWHNAVDNPNLVPQLITKYNASAPITDTGRLSERVRISESEQKQRELDVLGVSRIGKYLGIDTPGYSRLREYSKNTISKDIPHLIAEHMYEELTRVDITDKLSTSILETTLYEEEDLFSTDGIASEDVLFNALYRQASAYLPKSEFVKQYNFAYGKRVVGQSEDTQKASDGTMRKHLQEGFTILKEYLRYDIRFAHPEHHYEHERQLTRARFFDILAKADIDQKTLTRMMRDQGLKLDDAVVTFLQENVLRVFTAGLSYLDTATGNRLSGTRVTKETLYKGELHDWLIYLARQFAKNRAIVTANRMTKVDQTALSDAGFSTDYNEFSREIAPTVLANQAKNYHLHLNNPSNRYLDGFKQQQVIARYNLDNDGSGLPQEQLPCSFVLNGTEVHVWGPTQVIFKIDESNGLRSVPNSRNARSERYVSVTIRPDDVTSEDTLRQVFARASRRAIDLGKSVPPPVYRRAIVIDEPIADPSFAQAQFNEIRPQQPLFATLDGSTLVAVPVSYEEAQLPITELTELIQSRLKDKQYQETIGPKQQTESQKNVAFGWILNTVKPSIFLPNGFSYTTASEAFGDLNMQAIGGLSIEGDDAIPTTVVDHAVVEGAAAAGILGGVAGAMEQKHLLMHRHYNQSFETSSGQLLRFETVDGPKPGKFTKNERAGNTITTATLPPNLNFPNITEGTTIAMEVLKNPDILTNPKLIRESNPELYRQITVDQQAFAKMRRQLEAVFQQFPGQHLGDEYRTLLMTTTEHKDQYERINNAIISFKNVLGNEGIKRLLTEVLPRAQYGADIFSQVTKLLHEVNPGSIARALEQANSLFKEIEAIVKAPLLTKIVAKEVLEGSGYKNAPISYRTILTGPMTVEIVEYDNEFIVTIETASDTKKPIHPELVAKVLMECVGYVAKKKIIHVPGTRSGLQNVQELYKPNPGPGESMYIVNRKNEGLITFKPIISKQPLPVDNFDVVVIDEQGVVSSVRIGQDKSEPVPQLQHEALALPFVKSAESTVRIVRCETPQKYGDEATLILDCKIGKNDRITALDVSNSRGEPIIFKDGVVVLSEGTYNISLSQGVSESLQLQSDMNTVRRTDLTVQVHADGTFAYGFKEIRNLNEHLFYPDSAIESTVSFQNASKPDIRRGRIVIRGGEDVVVQQENRFPESIFKTRFFGFEPNIPYTITIRKGGKIYESQLVIGPNSIIPEITPLNVVEVDE